MNATAAETYEDFFVPSLFGQWPDRVLDCARLALADEVLDVGCGTGIVARAAARRLGGTGSVTGIDINDGMLAVAGRSPESVTWQHAAAEQLPFPDRSFDRVVSQFALMFFADRQAALREMARVTRPGGTITIATWASVDRSPGYAAMIDLLQQLFGDDAADALRAPFTIGTAEELAAVLEEVFPNATISCLDGVARFDSLDAWVHTDIRGWTLADRIDDAEYDQLLGAARDALADFVGDDGGVRFAAPALVAVASVHSPDREATASLSLS